LLIDVVNVEFNVKGGRTISFANDQAQQRRRAEVFALYPSQRRPR
jgi:hypothetical protein